MSKQHEITKSDLRETNWQDVDLPPLADGEARLSIDAFALTANNVTYAAFGGAPMHYYNQETDTTFVSHVVATISCCFHT